MDISVLLINAVIFIYGTAIGSFLNVLSDRLPQEESIMGRSHCEKCKHSLAWYDLFPLVSFISLKARCRYCKTKLSFFYPLTELLTGVMFILTWNFIPVNSLISQAATFIYVVKFAYLVITSVLLVIFFADLKFQIIPDSMQVVLLLIAVILRLIAAQFNLNGLFYPLIEGVLVMAPILLLYVLTKGRGMGFGDVKLAFVIGVLFGVKMGWIILYMSFLFGALGGLYLMFFKRRKIKSKIAFGPFIVLAMFIALFFNAQLLSFLHSLWGI